MNDMPSLWLRGIIPRTVLQVPSPPSKVTARMNGVYRTERMSQERYYEYCTDGSGVDGEHPLTRGCGWSAVAIAGSEDACRLQWAIYGGLPGNTRTVPRAEITDVAMAMRVGQAPIGIYTNRRSAAQRFARGPEVDHCL